MNSMVDLEFGIGQNSNTVIKTTNITTTDTNIKSCSQIPSGMYNFLACSSIILLILPLAICDLYLAWTDDSCVYNNTVGLSINLHNYLLFSGLTSIGVILLCPIVICFGIILLCVNFKCCPELVLFFSIGIGIIGFFFGLFLLCWNIIGGAIFWSFMDNSTCSSVVYNYVFASLIIKYIFSFVGLVSIAKIFMVIYN